MRFFLHDENTKKEYSFTVNIDNKEFFDNEEPYDSLINWMADEAIESTYGVQDSIGDKTGSGFSSYEVLDKNYPELLEKYKQWFNSQGYKTSSKNSVKKNCSL